jgi:hypothetical protein
MKAHQICGNSNQSREYHPAHPIKLMAAKPSKSGIMPRGNNLRQ